MKIALCQVNTIVGNIEYNKSRIIDGYKKAVNDAADLVIFPELSLIGYPPLDLVEKKEFRQASLKALAEIADQSGEVGLLFGTITEDDDNIGTDIHNSAVLCYNGKVQFIQHKSLIPNYDVFDEMRYFDPAKSIYVHEFKGEKLGISVCEDIWNDADYWYKQRYSYDPVKDLIEKHASVIVNISASPYSFGKRESRKNMLSVLCKTEKIPLAYVCDVGAQTELIFDGASMCFDNEGNLVKLGKAFEEDYFIFDTKEKCQPVKSSERSFEEETLSALIFGLKEYCSKQKFRQVLVGLSGGIDSALVTYIAVKAIGPENVNVMLMPSIYSSEGSIKDSEKLIKNLGILSSNVSIQPVVKEVLKMLSSVVTEKHKRIVEENIQARIRGVYLMAVSNQFGYLLLTTGNKSEMAVGYCTLYGDMAGGLGVIADVYKTDVYRIVNYINKEKEIIPKEIVEKEPSAELSLGQKDQDILPPYELLDKILKMYLEENKEYDEITKIIGDGEVVNKVLKMVDNNEYKRRQAAPALRVSTKAFGYGRRYPVVQGWRK
ncbi:MAG: NAD+ synthase [Ignavibacteria bacterium GWA2_35_9]|nr:MAG: NAD+ synthase [Ignavibacteria bacterium GWA2_35_9]OGU53046.1 MAG: NAD+ synthase [Ignavibacteria bacterium GWC2_36_12]